jgi:protein SCO1/2
MNPSQRWSRRARAALLSGLLAGTLGSPVLAHNGPHQHPEAVSPLKDSVADYRVPDVWLVRDDGQRVQLQDELNDSRAVLLNFVYTTCPGICPMMSAVFSQVQDALGDARDQVHMVSVSIDPEQDTPARLRAYAQRYDAGRQWRHYTGTVAASVQVQKAFKAYGGDKMNHAALTLMRPASEGCWLRVDGFATAQDLLSRYRSLGKLCGAADSARR